MDQRHSDNPHDHVGYLIYWSREVSRKKRFPAWTTDEILSEAYIQTNRLLSTIYDAEKSSVITFLKAFLWGAVHYAYWKERGYRFTEKGLRLKIPLSKDSSCDEQLAAPTEKTFCPPIDLTEEEWTIIRLRCDGYTMTRIADVLELKSPQSVYNRLTHIREKFQQDKEKEKDVPSCKPSPPSKRSRKKCPPLP